MKPQRTLLLSLLITFSLSINSQTTIYVNDMDYVLGDAKQAFIQNKVSTMEQVEGLITGFKSLKVNGIRVPIFPAGENPDEAVMTYFIKRANEEGFPIFANPAQGGGGARIANQDLKVTSGTKGDSLKTQILIARVLEFEKKHHCKWINPFNEDSKTGSMWSIEQMNTIYSTVKAGLVNAELIGPCVWGIPASIDVFQKTNIKDYITVSTTHNLGHNHAQWPAFIEMSHDAGLPVWDSEVNDDDKYNNGNTRIVAAIEYGVDGLVLYNSWKFFNLATGVLTNTGQNFMNFYIKPSALETVSEENTIADIYTEGPGFRIQFISSGLEYNVNITDITGKQIQCYDKVANEVLHINNLQKGLYIVTLTSDHQEQVEKVMVH